MSLSTKAIFATLVLTLSPIAASAQTFIYPIAPGPDVQINGVAIPEHLQGVAQSRPNATQVGTPVAQPEQASSCGATEHEHFIGQPVSLMHDAAVFARYFTPEHFVGTMDFLPHRLNVTSDENGIVTTMGCG